MITNAVQEKYSDFIAQDARYLGVLDLALIAEKYNKEIGLIYYDDDWADQLVCKRLSHHLWRVTARQVGSEIALEPDRTSENSWFVMACRADFVMGTFTTLNHFVPLWTKEQLGSLWDFSWAQTMQKVEKNGIYPKANCCI